MFKKWITLFFISMTGIWTIAYAGTPDINCEGLPGCSSGWSAKPLSFISWVIASAIEILAAIAVIALVCSGIMYILSGWDEEKTKRAKTWIISSIVGVLVSLSAWWVIGTLNAVTVTI